MKKRILSIIFCLCMVVTFMPMTAYAGAGSAMQMGKGGIVAGDTIYFGQYTSGSIYNVPWTVLGSDILSGTRVSSGISVLPLLSAYTLGTSEFQNIDDGGTSYYPNSTLNTTMINLYSGGNKIFSTGEQGAIADTTLAEKSMYYSGMGDLSEQKLFPLCYSEGENLGWKSGIMKAKSISDHNGDTGEWWLRSYYTEGD